MGGGTNNVSYTGSEGNLSFSVMTDNGVNANASIRSGGDNAASSKGDVLIGKGTPSYSSTDVDVAAVVYISHHCLPAKEEFVEVRGAAGEDANTVHSSHSDRTGSRNLSADDVAGSSPSPSHYNRQHSSHSNPSYPRGGGAFRRLRRVERVTHSIEAPVIISLTSPGATDPSEYPDVKSFAIAVSGVAYKYATSDSWGVPSYRHPATVAAATAATAHSIARQPTAQQQLAPTVQQSPTPEFRTKPIIQPDLLDRFDVFKADCTPENTVSSLCDGFGRKTDKGHDMPITVIALDARLHGILCILHVPKESDHEVYCLRDEMVHEGLQQFAENSLVKGF